MSMETKQGPGQPAARTARTKATNAATPTRVGCCTPALWLIAVLVVVFFSMAWIFDFYGKVQSLGKPASPFEDARVLPPAPRLQVRTARRAACILRAAGQTAESYGWADEHNGVVRIPVDRAMELTLQQGLPARAAGEFRRGQQPPRFTPDVSDQDQTGPCGFVLERDKDMK